MLARKNKDRILLGRMVEGAEKSKEAENYFIFNEISIIGLY
jgi:hypothetical protein